jgi:hypothetical protein
MVLHSMKRRNKIDCRNFRETARLLRSLGKVQGVKTVLAYTSTIVSLKNNQITGGYRNNEISVRYGKMSLRRDFALL